MRTTNLELSTHASSDEQPPSHPVSPKETTFLQLFDQHVVMWKSASKQHQSWALAMDH
jgi:hypothetical protein